ncbi:SdrD B-like domain-containing protein, partial [Siccirubricoccus deserti]
MEITRSFANVTDDGLLFSNIHASEISVGTTNSALGDAGMAPVGAVNPPTGAIAGLRWNSFVAGASGPGSSLTITIDYDVTSTDPMRLISAIRTNSFVPDSAVPVGVTLSLSEEIFDATNTLVASSTLTRTQSINDTVDPPFETGDLQLSAGYATLHVRVTVTVSIAESAAAGAASTFSVMNQTFNTAAAAHASLGDYVFEDRNANGVQDSGEAGIAGVTVELLDAAGAVVATTITGSAGAYRFTGLVPGTYSTRFVTPDGYVPTVANQGSDDAADSDAVGGVTQQVTLASGEFNGTLDAGFYRPASLGDYVFEDRNANGVQDSGEAGIAGVTVELLDATGAVVATTITGSAGAYRFTGLVPGTYSTRFVTPDGYVPTVANQGSDDAADSDAVGGVTQQVTLASGEFNGTLDAGFYRPASLGDYVFEDRNA